MAAGRWKVRGLANGEVGRFGFFKPVGWPRRIGFALVGLTTLCGVGGTACVSLTGLREVGGVYHHSEPGYRIGHPGRARTVRTASTASTGWKRIDVEGADLAFREVAPEAGQRPAMMLLMSECGRGADNLWLVARQLLIGLGDRALVRAAPMAHRGLPGWTQVFDTLSEGVAVRVKTVSIRSDGCTFDWALVAPRPFGVAEQQFDAWWASFERVQEPASHPAALRLAFPRYAAARVTP